MAHPLDVLRGKPIAAVRTHPTQPEPGAEVIVITQARLLAGDGTSVTVTAHADTGPLLFLQEHTDDTRARELELDWQQLVGRTIERAEPQEGVQDPYIVPIRFTDGTSLRLYAADFYGEDSHLSFEVSLAQPA